MENEIEKINNVMQNLVLFRGTKEWIINRLSTIGTRTDIFLEPFEEPLPNNDFGFNTNLGMIGSHYLDYEIYMLPTNAKDVFVITEVSEF